MSYVKNGRFCSIAEANGSSSICRAQVDQRLSGVATSEAHHNRSQADYEGEQHYKG